MAKQRWKLFEGVVAALERSVASVPGAEVIANAKVPERVSRRKRQVDVVVEIPYGNSRFRIGVEAKDESAPLDVTAIEQLGAKHQKLDLDRGVVVSSSGYTRGAEEAARGCGLELRTLREIARPSWWLPSHIETYSRQVTLLHVGLNFPQEHSAIVESILTDEFNVHDVSVVVDGVASSNLHEQLSQAAIKALEVGGPLGLDGPIELDLPTIALQFPDNLELAFHGSTLPRPTTASLRVRVQGKVDKPPAQFFRGPAGEHVITAVSKSEEMQLSIVMSDNEDGSRDLRVSRSEFPPKLVHLPVREEFDGGE